MKKTYGWTASNLSRSHRDALVILALGIFVWLGSLYLDLYDHLHKTLVAYEDYESDELLMGILTIGLMGFTFVIRRLQELKNEVARRTTAEINAEWLAAHDPLTGLFNRRFLDRKLEELNHAKSVKSLAGFAIDLNGFKKVNDLAGHEAGDMLLVDVTRKLKEIFPDDNVVRLGGDQFLVLAHGSSAKECKRRAAEIVESICEPSVISNIYLQVGVSVGIALYPQHVRSLSDFLHSADIAMYMAKRNGHNGICVFDASMEDELVRKAETEMAVRSAMKNNLIEPHYQPLINLATNEIEGFEALARWKEGADNALPPSVFIGVAENIGLIAELSDRLLRRACLDALQWPDSITLSYNVSPMQLADPLLGLRIIWALSETTFPPHRLQIEITEASLVNNLESAGKIIADLRRIGIKIALDDFGTGYSSLSQLSKLNFDRIKIDRSFVADFERDGKQMKIVKAIIALGHGLGIGTTAEGIEELSQVTKLKAMGCDSGQGYYYDKAMPAAAARALFKGEAAGRASAGQ